MNGFYLRLSVTGIRNKAKIWLRSFLTGRSQRVVVVLLLRGPLLIVSGISRSGNRIGSHSLFDVY